MLQNRLRRLRRGDLISCLHVCLQIINILDIELGISRHNENGRIQVFNKLEIIVSELHLCRIKNGGDGEKSLTCENEFRIVCFRFSNPAIYRCRVTLYCVSDENDLIRISI